jgi:hypothetical protein
MREIPTSKSKRIKRIGRLNGTSRSACQSMSSRYPEEFAFRSFAGQRLVERQNSDPLVFWDRHPRDDGHRPCKQLDLVGRDCVAICVAAGLDSLSSQVKPRLFASRPRHVTEASDVIPGLWVL